jgi:hypothetical protein
VLLIRLTLGILYSMAFTWVFGSLLYGIRVGDGLTLAIIAALEFSCSWKWYRRVNMNVHRYKPARHHPLVSHLTQLVQNL